MFELEAIKWEKEWDLNIWACLFLNGPNLKPKPIKNYLKSPSLFYSLILSFSSQKETHETNPRS